MATYNPKQLLNDYANGRITPEMAVGHSLQHIDQLYATQAAVRSEWRAETDALKEQLSLVQATVARLQVVIDKARAKQKLRHTPTPSTPEQP